MLKIIELLDKAIKDKGLKKTWVASKAGINRTYLYLILTEKRTPSAEVIVRLTEAVFGRKDENKKRMQVRESS